MQTDSETVLPDKPVPVCLFVFWSVTIVCCMHVCMYLCCTYMSHAETMDKTRYGTSIDVVPLGPSVKPPGA